MCNKRNSTPIIIGKKKIKVDDCLSTLIDGLNKSGVKTLSCCCGHNIYPTTIVIRRNGQNSEIISGVNIPRKKRFYVMDKKGFYFIPETLKRLNDAVPCELKR